VVLDGNVLTNVVAIAAARKYSLALKNDGTVIGWGNKQLYEPVPAGLTNVTAIAVGEGFCLAIKKP
jgi:alpha-tubulin suppressor-like RCC1 family protein